MPELNKVSSEDLPKERWVKRSFIWWPQIVAYDGDKPIRRFFFEERIKKRGMGFEQYLRPRGQSKYGGVMRYYPIYKADEIPDMIRETSRA